MCPIEYYMMLRNYKDPKQLRLKLVLYADEHGKKATARRFATTVSTVRKWHGRWKIKGLAGLEEMSRRPHNCPNAISQEVRKHVIAIKKGKKTLGIAWKRLNPEATFLPRQLLISITSISLEKIIPNKAKLLCKY